jgi:hypothetical protein
VEKYGISADRYGEFEYLTYLTLGDSFVENYARCNLGLEEPIIKGRIKSYFNFWNTFTTLPWLLDIIKAGVKIPNVIFLPFLPTPRIVPCLSIKPQLPRIMCNG